MSTFSSRDRHSSLVCVSLHRGLVTDLIRALGLVSGPVLMVQNGNDFPWCWCVKVGAFLLSDKCGRIGLG